MITEEAGRAILDNISKDDPTRWVAAVQTLLLDSLKTNESLAAAVTKRDSEIVDLKKKLDTVAKGAYMMSRDVALIGERLRIVRPAAPAPADEAAAAGDEAATEAGEGVTEETEIAGSAPAPASAVGADDQPRSPEQMAIESSMDAAIAAGDAEKHANGGHDAPSPMTAGPRASGGPGSRPRAPVAPPPRARRAPANGNANSASAGAGAAPVGRPARPPQAAPPVAHAPGNGSNGSGDGDPELAMDAAIAAMDKPQA